MAKYEFLQPKFTEGVLARAFHGRSSEEFYHYGLKSCKNMIPTLSGPCVKRPGTNFIGEAKNSTATFIPFFKDKDNTYILEIGYASSSSYLRVWSQNQLLDNKVTTLSDTTPTGGNLSGAWQTSQTPAINALYADVVQLSTSGLGTGIKFSIVTDGSGNPTVTITTIGSGYLVSDTIVIRDPGSTSSTATVTIASIPSIFEVTGLPWSAAEILTLKTTQSGDNIFVCSPSKIPYRIIRTIDLTDTGTDVCEDGSKWSLSKFVFVDGPYNDINIFKEDGGASTKDQYTLKLKTEPNPATSVQNKIIANVEFDVTTNSIVLMNHGLQMGMKVRLLGQGPSGTVTASNDGGIKFTAASPTPHILIDGDTIQITAGTTLPTGITADVTYFVRDATTTIFRLAPAADGTAIPWTDAGSGTLTYTSSWGNLVNADATPKGYSGTKDWYVVSTTAGSFKVSDTDSGIPYEFVLINDDATSPNVNVLLSRPRYKAGTDVVFDQLLAGVATTSSNHLITSTDIGRLIRINPLARPLEALGAIRWAWGVIKSIATDEVTVTLKTEICNTRQSDVADPVTKGTPEFRLGAFSDTLGWPQVAQIYQQRMVFAATTTQPSTIWLSKTANFFSFAPTEIAGQDSGSAILDGVATEIITDANGLNFTLDSDTLDEIKWLAESKKLTMGTSAGVYMLYGSETNLVVSPFRFTINRETSFSATDTIPIVVSNTLIYSQIGGKDVQALVFEGQQGQWFSSKISLKGYDIIKTSEIKKMVWQERPNNIIWVMMDDGRLLSLSYDRVSEFQAWAEHLLAGTDVKVTDIDMIPTASHDQIWLKVERTINGATKYYVETLGRFPKEGALARNAYIFSDSALTKSIAGSTFTVASSSGLLITSVAHGLIDTQLIQVTNSGGALPNTLDTGVDYFVKYVSADTFRLAITSGGTSITYHAGSGIHSWKTKVINGHTHLVGETVQIYYQGMQHISKVVSSIGTVSLDHFQGTDTVVGLPYEGELETLEPAAPDNQYSYSKRLLNLVLLIEESLGIQIEYNDLEEEILFRSMQDQMGVQIDLFSGKRELSLSGIGWAVHNLKIISNGPFPMQINALVIESETGGT